MSRSFESRTAVRLLVTSTKGVLLIRKHDPGIPGSGWWCTPGGGVDSGETLADAAVRELAEEAGIPIQPDQLAGPIAYRHVTHGYSDHILTQHETFFRVHVEPFTPKFTLLTGREKQFVQAIEWIPEVCLAELDVLWPVQLPEMLKATAVPLQLGRVQESTVRVQ